MLLRMFAIGITAFIAVFVPTSQKAMARVPLEVAIGSSQGVSDFKANGYGILASYKGRCVVVTLAHVINPDSDDYVAEEITVRSNNLSSSISYIDADQERDLFVGAVDLESPLSRLCEEAEDISDLNNQYNTRLGNMLDRDFRDLTLHATPLAIDLTAMAGKSLGDAKRRKPIRYGLTKCESGDSGDCLSPIQGFSGSMISMDIGAGDRLWLGLHQRSVRAGDGRSEDAWQAVSVMQIYEFIASPNSPLNAEPTLAGPQYDTPFPGGADMGRQYREAAFQWDIAFSKFLTELLVMRFPQESDQACNPGCTVWNLREFYSSGVIPGGLEAFKSRYADLGDAGSTLIGTTMSFKKPFNKKAFLDVLATGKRLNEIIDETQRPPENQNLGDRLGFAVNGSADAWIKFYERVPSEYIQYVKAVQEMFDKYCTMFKPAADIETANVGEVFFGNLAAYEDPCLKRLTWDKMVEGDPTYVISKLRKGF